MQINCMYSIIAMHSLCLFILSLATLFPSSWFNKHLHTLRITMHMVAQITHCILYQYAIISHATSTTLVEKLTSHLSWLCLYPVIAGIPLALSINLQILTFIICFATNRSLCSRATGFHDDSTTLRIWTTTAMKAANTLPVGFSVSPTTTTIINSAFENINKSISSAIRYLFDTVRGSSAMKSSFVTVIESDQLLCENMLTSLNLFIIIVLSSYLTFLSELSSRETYAKIIADAKVVAELKRRKIRLWQLVGELAVSCCTVWHISIWITESRVLFTS